MNRGYQRSRNVKKVPNEPAILLTNNPVISQEESSLENVKVSASYKTFDMVTKLLSNGSVTKTFFERYGEKIAQKKLIITPETQRTEIKREPKKKEHLRKMKNAY